MATRMMTRGGSPPMVGKSYRVPTVDEVVAGLLESYGTKGRTRIHLMGGGKPIVTTMPPEVAAHQLTNEPQTLLLVPRRDDSGHIKPAWVRAGAILWVEEA